MNMNLTLLFAHFLVVFGTCGEVGLKNYFVISRIFVVAFKKNVSHWDFFRRILKPHLDFLSPRFVYGPTRGLVFLGSCVVCFGFVQSWVMFFFRVGARFSDYNLPIFEYTSFSFRGTTSSW